MRHFLYCLWSSPVGALAGDGDTESWFRYYKWDTTGEVFVPVRAPFLAAEVGDTLWFSMDGELLGCAPIHRVDTPLRPTQTQELWYDADKIEEMTCRVQAPPTTRQVESEEASKWATMTRKRS
jgi:hypothetical protein